MLKSDAEGNPMTTVQVMSGPYTCAGCGKRFEVPIDQSSPATQEFIHCNHPNAQIMFLPTQLGPHRDHLSGDTTDTKLERTGETV
jgi:hypothetical protein